MFIALLEAMRPRQWAKNVFVLAAIAFGQRLHDKGAIAWSLGAFIIFCFLSSSVYIVNDIVDAEQDRQHPTKRNRPIASGRLPVAVAVPSAILLAGFSMVLSRAIGVDFAVCAGIYLVLNLLYSFALKHVVIVDVLCVAIFFVLRAAAGAEAINVEISRWLVICTLTLALFIALSKRRHELVLLEENASAHRVSLTEYTPYLLDQMISVATASTLMAYVLYTVDTRTIDAFGRAFASIDASPLIYTIPCVVFGIFRYLYLIHQKGEGGDPDRVILSDRPFFVNLLVWVGIVAAVVYLG
ncbi:MAG: decaprenyl-phosphate phosphoribosyltransferase [Armatimonadota bacterium]|nr:decaprenyl-phosphate phosphoribosyltransferase [Armatimonadota bacterium]